MKKISSLSKAKRQTGQPDWVARFALYSIVYIMKSTWDYFALYLFLHMSFALIGRLL